VVGGSPHVQRAVHGFVVMTVGRSVGPHHMHCDTLGA
jgi:hypothetical protein